MNIVMANRANGNKVLFGVLAALDMGLYVVQLKVTGV